MGPPDPRQEEVTGAIKAPACGLSALSGAFGAGPCPWGRGMTEAEIHRVGELADRSSEAETLISLAHVRGC